GRVAIDANRASWGISSTIAAASTASAVRMGHQGTALRWKSPALLAAGSKEPDRERRWSGHFSCPSWARTRTLLIQRGPVSIPNSGKLQPKREVVTSAAGVH